MTFRGGPLRGPRPAAAVPERVAHARPRRARGDGGDGRGGRADPGRQRRLRRRAREPARPRRPARRGAHAARLRPETLRRVRDPALLGASLRAAGFAYPRTFSADEAPARAGSHAPLAAQAGPRRRRPRGARVARRPAARRRDRAGAHRRRSRAPRRRSPTGAPPSLLGVSEQLIGRRALGARGWKWCGNVAPPRLPAAEQRRAGRRRQAICAHLAAAFGLRGVFGVDLVWDGARPWVVEVNPRPVASLETIDAAHGVRSFAAHLEALRRPPAGARRAEPVRGGRQGGAVRDRGRAGPGHQRLDDARDPRRAPPRRGDRAPAARSARSSRRAAPRRPCSPTWRRAPRRCAPSSTTVGVDAVA